MSQATEEATAPTREKMMATAAICFAVFMWGVTPVATRFLVNADTQLIAPGPMVAIRFTISAILLLPFLVKAKPQSWTREDLLYGVMIAICGVVGYNLPITLGQVWVSAGTTALIIATEPVWILILWAMKDRRRPSLGATAGAIVGFLGICLLVSVNTEGSGEQSLVGILYICVGAFFWSLYCVLAAPFIKKKGSLGTTAFTVVVGCIPLLAMFAPSIPEAVQTMPSEAFIPLIILAVGSTVIATICWNYGISMMPGPRSGAFLHGIPIVGVLAGALVLSEPVSWGILVAAVMVIAGVIIAQKGEKGRP